MTIAPALLELTWAGPSVGQGTKPTTDYLQTFEYQAGYLIYAAGQTSRPMRKRFLEHTKKYMNGEYNVLDIAPACQGVRTEVWHGWTYARSHRDEFEARKASILDAVRAQLSGFRIFVAAMPPDRRMLSRHEAAIMRTLEKQPPPFCHIPDKGMQLAPRWDSEEPIVVKGTCGSILYGLPSLLEI